ncbi:hypothetical protein MBM_01086 [Drepanopeziza brunnea f. sp. 'multigermtubi' MB_m1]|uniref:Uncharacterized protein n=1 Tax=Marssonina brunnea f. sp. multigermtubi (strain MB_m1) TaxID=1072389 RepID=K1Y5E4_MARBU|nr:uncharacterized protein MBM_01086 [Drepanopeziza brunnea f. sp. 'multigermtubi' MB_m1]EKD20404.1 hypothetical protein MBM_01086 [Drepanopeziza brunnea f. sp. 'multigermtubi' MB_m1]
MSFASGDLYVSGPSAGCCFSESGELAPGVGDCRTQVERRSSFQMQRRTTHIRGSHLGSSSSKSRPEFLSTFWSSHELVQTVYPGARPTRVPSVLRPGYPRRFATQEKSRRSRLVVPNPPQTLPQKANDDVPTAGPEPDPFPAIIPRELSQETAASQASSLRRALGSTNEHHHPTRSTTHTPSPREPLKPSKTPRDRSQDTPSSHSSTGAAAHRTLTRETTATDTFVTAPQTPSSQKTEDAWVDNTRESLPRGRPTDTHDSPQDRPAVVPDDDLHTNRLSHADSLESPAPHLLSGERPHIMSAERPYVAPASPSPIAGAGAGADPTVLTLAGSEKRRVRSSSVVAAVCPSWDRARDSQKGGYEFAVAAIVLTGSLTAIADVAAAAAERIKVTDYSTTREHVTVTVTDHTTTAATAAVAASGDPPIGSTQTRPSTAAVPQIQVQVAGNDASSLSKELATGA